MNKQTTDVKDEEYSKRKDEFTEKLLTFHRMRGNPVRRFPLLGGRELDLYHLYTKVQQLGGSEVVTKERNWGEVSRSFNLPPTVTSASYACRQNFLKFLLEYEQVEIKGSFFEPSDHMTKSTPPIRQVRVPPVIQATPTPPAPSPVNSRIPQNSFSALSSRLPNLLALPGLQGLGNLLDQLGKAPNQLQVLSNMLNLPPNQIQLLELLMRQRQVQQQTKLSEDSRIDWLIRSLQSGFPNELDFTLNTLLVMSVDDSVGVMPLSKVPHLVDVLLAHVGVFNRDDPYLEILYREAWHVNDGRDYHRMWAETTPDHVYFSVLDTRDHSTNDHFTSLFSVKSFASEDSPECLHVCQVAMVMRNFSFDEGNAQFLASHQATLRFLLLGINCSLPLVQTYSLDMLANIIPHLSLMETEEEEQAMDDVRELIMNSLQELVLSENRYGVLIAVECLGSLAYMPRNNACLTQIYPEVFQRMLQFLLLPDFELVLACLDTLYCLTYSGRTISETIYLHCDHCISILVRLLTYGFQNSNNVIEGLMVTHSNGRKDVINTTKERKSTETDSKEPRTKDNRKERPSSASSGSSSVGHSRAVTMTPGGVSSATPTAGTPHRQPKASRDPVLLTNRFSIPTQVDENKIVFGKHWLNTFYEPYHDEFVSKQDMYTKYLISCSQMKIKTAATQNEFDLIIKETFPKTRITSVNLSSQDIQLVNGLRKKLLSTITQQPSNSSRTTESLSRDSSPTPSRSPSPLSPLQQLIQQTKTKSLTTPSSVAKASPLLVANKMTPSNQPIKTAGSKESGRILDKNHPLLNNEHLSNMQLNRPELSRGTSPIRLNGNATTDEVKALLASNRKRPLQDVQDSPVAAKVYRIEETKKENSLLPKEVDNKFSSSVIATPTSSGATTPIIKSSGTATPSTISSSSGSATPISLSGPHLASPSLRSSSLPPSLDLSNTINTSTPIKARSLTPPLINKTPPIINDLSLDTAKLAKQVSSTSSTSLPGNSTQSSSIRVCLWMDCLLTKGSPDDLFYHIMYDHILSPPTDSTHFQCEWTGCTNKSKRMTPSLLRHVQTYHCASNNQKPVLPNVAQTLLRLRAVPTWEFDEETAITKSVHLTAALVLRNVIGNFPPARLSLMGYEHVLTQVALSNSEASSIVAQCLFLLANPPPPSSDDSLSPSKAHPSPSLTTRLTPSV